MVHFGVPPGRLRLMRSGHVAKAPKAPAARVLWRKRKQIIVFRRFLVPLAGIEPALLAESDFESDASTSSAIGATDRGRSENM